MNKCSECKNSIPEHLLAPMISSDGNQMDICGVCALRLSNDLLGIERKSFSGETAEFNRLEAIKHYKKTKQKIK